MASAQKLTQLPSIPGTITPTSANTLSANMAALANIGRPGLKAIAAYSLTFLLNANGHTDYRTNLPQLVSDAKAFMGRFSLVCSEENLQKLLMQTVMDWNAGNVADATLSTDVFVLLKNASLLAAYPEETLNKILLFERYVEAA